MFATLSRSSVAFHLGFGDDALAYTAGLRWLRDTRVSIDEGCAQLAAFAFHHGRSALAARFTAYARSMHG
jgi:hypothetical protein